MSEYIYRSYGEPLANERGEIHLACAGEIVRCRDCRYYYESTIDEDGEGEPSFCTRWGEEWVREDGFCAWGEREVNQR